MFQNKHIIRASFISLFIAILASILFYRYFTIKNIVLETVIKENNKIAVNYINGIWNKYTYSTVLIKKTTLEKAIKDKEFREFSDASLEYLADQQKARISILNSNGIEFLTTNDNLLKRIEFNDPLSEFLVHFDEYFLRRQSYDASINAVYSGKTIHNIILGSSLLDDKTSRIYEESIYPISDPSIDDADTEGAVRIITDITEEWNKIKYFEKRVSIFLIGVFILFYIIVLFNTNHAQKIIDQQVANNKILEEARQRAEFESTAKTQFLANVSHELRTPLNAIIGFSEVILTEAYGKLQPEQYREYITDINNSGKHLLSVITDILDFSKASADKLKIDMIEVDATKLASSSLRFVKPRADEAKVNLVEKLPKDHVVIKADPKRLKQALLNLLSNSVKFTPENGSVTLELEKNIQDHTVIFRVVDTGIGMEEKDIPKALSSFGQIDNKLSRKYEGTGLGLPLTKKLVEMMEGKFDITSKPGVGTTVTLTFKYEEL